jgi:HEPN domain-containing protein
MNRTAALEWLRIAYHDLRSAQILYDAQHYTDSIGTDLQQAIEKTLKAFLAAENRKIPKTHDLYELYISVDGISVSPDELTFLDRATEYFKEERYPHPNYSLPSREEIKEVMTFSENLLKKSCGILKIGMAEIRE